MRGWGSHRSARRSMRFQLRRRVRWLRRRSALSQCLVTRQRKPERRAVVRHRVVVVVPAQGAGQPASLVGDREMPAASRPGQSPPPPPAWQPKPSVPSSPRPKRTSWPGPSPPCPRSGCPHAGSGSSAAPGSPRHTALDASDRCADRAAASRTTALPNQQPPGKHGAHHGEPGESPSSSCPCRRHRTARYGRHPFR